MADAPALSRHDDDLADALALLTAMRSDDTEGIAVVMRELQAYQALLITSAMLADWLDHGCVSQPRFRDWVLVRAGRMEAKAARRAAKARRTARRKRKGKS
jgi:hypothetical protein